MLQKLQQKWKVSGLQLILIILTFAIGGSITGFVAKKLMNLLTVQQDWLWAIIYILLVTIFWPLAVIIVSIPFGQFSFFRRYIRKIGVKMGLVKKKEEDNQQSKTKRIAIFASGAGSNAQKIIEHLTPNPSPLHGEGNEKVPIARVSLIVCSKPEAGVLKIAEKENIPSLLIQKEKFFRGNAYINELKEKQIDFIVLAGFLWKVPGALIKAYPQKIINIHPALLPKYGGKGMYGHHVHQAVIDNKEKESGISIHYVDELYDHGKIIFQAKCPVLPDDKADSLAQRIHQLEHEHYPKVIEEILRSEV